MVWTTHEYDEIPGSYVFDGKRAYSAYGLNKLFYSFNHQQNRDAFAADPAAYCEIFGLSEEQTELVINQDFLGVLRSGANIYFMAKFAVPRGMTMQDTGAAFQSVSSEEFRARLLEKREGLEDRLAEEGGFWNG